MVLNISTALAGSAGLAGLQELLLGAPAREALRAVLASRLANRAQLGELTLQRAKYKPGRYLTCYFAAHVRDHNGHESTRLLEATWQAPGVADRRGDRPALEAMQAEASERGLAAPFRTLLAEAPESGLYIQLFPLDARFPKLARLADPAYIRALLAATPEIGGKAASYQVTPIRYRPGQRHVLRYDALGIDGQAGKTLFAKVYANDKGAQTFQVATRVSGWLAEQSDGIGAARPLVYIASEGLVLYPRVTGTPLSDLLQNPGPATASHIYAAGAALRALHATPQALVELQPHSFAKELKGIASASEHIEPLHPAAGARIGAILAAAQTLHERLPEETPGFAYGDFKADHLWVTPAGMTLIDFDTCYLCDPAIDLGKFLADLHWWYDGYRLSGVDEAQAQFLAGYGQITPARLLRARLYEALVLTKSTARRVKLFDPDWTARTERLIGTAGRILEKLSATAGSSAERG